MADVAKYQVWVDGRKKHVLDSQQVALDQGDKYAERFASVRVVRKEGTRFKLVARWVDGERK